MKCFIESPQSIYFNVCIWRQFGMADASCSRHFVHHECSIQHSGSRVNPVPALIDSWPTVGLHNNLFFRDCSAPVIRQLMPFQYPHVGGSRLLKGGIRSFPQAWSCPGGGPNEWILLSSIGEARSSLRQTVVLSSLPCQRRVYLMLLINAISPVSKEPLINVMSTKIPQRAHSAPFV